MALKDARRCKAKAKNTGERCKNPAVTGYEVCRFHGAGTPSKGKLGGRPIKTGRYSKHLPTRLAARYNEAQNDPDLLQLRDEVALLDTRIGELLVSLQDGDTRKLWTDLQDAWSDLEMAQVETDPERKRIKTNEALGKIGRIVKRGNGIYQSWHEIYGVVDQRRKTVESERKRLVEMHQTITVERLILLMTAIAGIVKSHVDDTRTIRAIEHEIQGLLTTGA